jgi:hypothetical protein
MPDEIFNVMSALVSNFNYMLDELLIKGGN